MSQASTRLPGRPTSLQSFHTCRSVGSYPVPGMAVEMCDRIASAQYTSTWSADCSTALLHQSVGRNASCRPFELQRYVLNLPAKLHRDAFGVFMAKDWSADCRLYLLQLNRSADYFAARLHLSVGRRASCRPSPVKQYVLNLPLELCRDAFGVHMAKEWSADCGIQLVQLSTQALGRPTTLQTFCTSRSVGMHPVSRLLLNSMS